MPPTLATCGVTLPRLYVYDLPASFTARAPSCRVGFPREVQGKWAHTPRANRSTAGSSFATRIAGPGGVSLSALLVSLPPPPCTLRNTSNYALAGVFLAKALNYTCRTLDPVPWRSSPREPASNLPHDHPVHLSIPTHPTQREESLRRLRRLARALRRLRRLARALRTTPKQATADLFFVPVLNEEPGPRAHDCTSADCDPRGLESRLKRLRDASGRSYLEARGGADHLLLTPREGAASDSRPYADVDFGAAAFGGVTRLALEEGR